MKVCVFGLWHLGSVTSACLAKRGCYVYGLDFDRKTVDRLKRGNAPLYEPGLDEVISKAIKDKFLNFSTDPRTAVSDADFIWITFDTPVDENDKADIEFLRKNIFKIMPYIKDGVGVVISSQVPVGFTRGIAKVYLQKYPNKRVHFAVSPENLRLGKAMEVFLDPDRIIVGISDDEAKKKFTPLFHSVSRKVEWMTVESAEMTKHAINSFLALSVCFANEIASICEKTGADAKEVERGLKTECRIGPKAYVGPGVAFSGGTLARDINFLNNLSRRYRLPSFLIKSVNASNDFHKNWITRRCRDIFRTLKGRHFAFLGLTYKPGTDTLRRSFAVETAKSFYTQGAHVSTFDPAVKTISGPLKKILTLKNSVSGAVEGSDAVLIMTPWPRFRELSRAEIDLISRRVVIDPSGFLRDIFLDKADKYFAVGQVKAKR